MLHIRTVHANLFLTRGASCGVDPVADNLYVRQRLIDRPQALNTPLAHIGGSNAKVLSISGKVRKRTQQQTSPATTNVAKALADMEVSNVFKWTVYSGY